MRLPKVREKSGEFHSKSGKIYVFQRNNLVGLYRNEVIKLNWVNTSPCSTLLNQD